MAKAAQIPAPLKKGDCIGVFAPSSYVEKSDIEASAAALEKRGFRALIHPQTYLRYNQSAGLVQDKLEAFYSLLNNSDVKAIWAAGGGNRALHFIDHIDFKRCESAEKPLIGFSDVTVVLNALYAHCGLAGYHAPVFRQLHTSQNLDTTLAALTGDLSAASLDLKDAKFLNKGVATGPLIGGNLSLFQYLPQTLPNNFWNGGILFLEDCNEELSHIDRMLLHLKRLGVFNDVKGIVLGEFTGLKDSARPYGFTLGDIFKDSFEELNIPIVAGGSFGHAQKNSPLIVGATYTLDSTKLKLRPQNRK
ncbi:MAG: LD-carboxypeptidase [Micavibrio sp.]|nr:LD-carboxypeptidase [Micavibrio sp.]